ncbi:MAG: PAS domain S-box protein [Aliidongia sp.]
MTRPHLTQTSLRWRVWRLAIIASCALAALGAVFSWTLERRGAASDRVEQTQDARRALGFYIRQLVNAETGQRGYLLTHQESYLTPYQRALADHEAKLAEVTALLTDGSTQPKLRELAAIFDRKLAELSETIELARAGDMDAAMAIVLEGRGRRDMETFQNLGQEIADTETNLLASYQAAVEIENRNVLAIMVISSILTIILIIGVAARTVARIDGPLRGLIEGIAALAAGDLKQRVEIQSHDEIGKVAAAFNDMADLLVASDRDREQADKMQTRLSALVTSSVDAIMSKTLDGIVTSWNPAAERMFGYTEQEMIGQPMALLIPPDRPEEEMRILAKIQNGENVDHFETIRRRKNGELFPISVTISPIRDATGTVTGASKIARDITDQKVAEAELEQYRGRLEELVSIATTEVNAIVQTAVSGIITIDAQGIIQVFNPSAERLFGWTKDEVVGKNISLLMTEPFSAQHDQYLDHFTATRPSKIIGIEREVSARRKDGGIFPAHLAVGHAVLSTSNHFFVGFITDISEQKQAEEVLKRAKETAEAGAHAKAAFVANMSHEIRTPMNAILGFAEVVLQDTDLPKQSARHVQIILSSAKALLGIINDVLDVSKLESGKFTLETVAFHLPNALADALQMVDHQAADKGLKIVLKYDADLPMRFMGDPTRLRQVVLNLVGNSIKFTEKGVVTVSVTRWHQPNMLHFTVIDDGIGMTPEQTAKVFEPFSQADVSTTRRFGGTGLGTAISKQITGLMGGEIWVESEHRKGSAFHFTAALPEASIIDGCLYEDGSAIVDGYISPRSFKVLLVEDIETNATLAKLRLKQQGHEVDWCANGLDAVAAFQAGRYDLILMDVMMPEMDGLEATRTIRGLEKPGERHTPIIALTASVMREDYDLCIVAGMDNVQAKPIDFGALLSAMEHAVPAGEGQPNTGQSIEIVEAIGVDFRPLEGIVDHRNAIRTWRDPAIYAKALTSFARDRSQDADEMERLLLASPDDSAPARAVAHALKGVAGNLFITKVAGCAIKIDSDLKSRRRTAAISELGQLRWLLAEAATAIGAIVTAADDTATPRGQLDPGAMAELFGELSAALGELNPDAVEPILARLAGVLPKTDLIQIQKAVDAFDFDAALAKTSAIAEQLVLSEG